MLPSRPCREAAIDTAVRTAWSTTPTTAPGSGASLAVDREFVGRRLLRGLLPFRCVISAVPASCVRRGVRRGDFGVPGSIPIRLALVDIEFSPLDDVDLGLPALIVVDVRQEPPSR